MIHATTAGIKRSTYDKATNTIVGASTITLNTFFNNVSASSIAYANGKAYIGTNLAGNSTRLQRVPIAGGAMTVVKDYPTNFSNATILDLTNCNNKLYYRAPISAGNSIFGLYMFDTTQPISGSNPSTTVITNNVNKLSCVANKLYYIGPQDSNTRGIFVIDTTTNIKTYITTGLSGSDKGNTADQYEQLVFGKDHFYYLSTINDSVTLNVKKVRLSDNVFVQTINTTTVAGIQGQYFYLSIGVDKANDDLYLAEADLGVNTTRIKKYNGVSNSYVGVAISGVLVDYQPEIMVSADYITWRHGGGGSTVSNLTKNGATVTNNSSTKVRKYKMYDGYYFMNLAGSSSTSNFDNTIRGASANTMTSILSNIGDFDIVDKP